jgi:hypothetical protein
MVRVRHRAIGKPSGELTISPVDGRARRRDWLHVPYIVFADDLAWTPPLLLQEKRRISPRYNPFFSFGEAAFFVAYRGGVPVGRISAQINHRYRQHYGSPVGHFGFFDCCNDPMAAGQLVDSAANWLRARGSTRMEGPFTLTINEESGLLVEGFDTPAAFLMNHSRPYMGSLLEDSGLSKIMDTYAYRVSPQRAQKQLARFVDDGRRNVNLTIRHFIKSKFDDELRTVIDIFNDAWSENWGFVPFSEAEMIALGKELKPFYRGHYGRIVLISGEPIAMIMGIPDINSIIRDFGGRLLPFNWFQLVTQLWRENWRTARIPLFGIRKAHQKSMSAAAILALLFTEMLSQADRHNIEWLEFSWVLEVNAGMNALARMIAGDPVKRYRLYGKTL